jgi:hypothetical protein
MLQLRLRAAAQRTEPFDTLYSEVAEGCMQLPPKASDKLRTSVRDYRLQNSVQA